MALRSEAADLRLARLDQRLAGVSNPLYDHFAVDVAPPDKNKKEAAWAMSMSDLSLSVKASRQHDASAENDDNAAGAPSGHHMYRGEKKSGLVLSVKDAQKKRDAAISADCDGNANSFSCDGCYESMFSEEDRSNPLRCCTKALCYLLCSPCILGYMLLRALWRGLVRCCGACYECVERCCRACCTCMNAIFDAIARFLSWLMTPVFWLAEQVYNRLLAPVGRAIKAICKAMCKAISSAWHAFSDWVLKPLGHAISCVCATIWSAITSVWRAFSDWVLKPLGRAIKCVCSTIWSAITAVWRAFSDWVLKPLGRAIKCVCSTIWTAIKGAGRVMRDYLLVPLRGYVINPLFGAAAAALRFVRDVFFVPIWRGIKTITAILTAMIVKPIQAIFDYIGSMFAPNSRSRNR